MKIQLRTSIGIDFILVLSAAAPCSVPSPLAMATLTPRSNSTSTLIPPTITPIPPTTMSSTASGHIACVSSRNGNGEIYVMNPDGSEQTNLTNNPAADSYPAWSPDWTRTCFTSNRESNNEIYMMDADGSHPVNLTNNPADDEMGTWSPDGKKVLFISNRDDNYVLYMMKADGSDPVRLTDAPAYDGFPAWSMG